MKNTASSCDEYQLLGLNEQGKLVYTRITMAKDKETIVIGRAFSVWIGAVRGPDMPRLRRALEALGATRVVGPDLFSARLVVAFSSKSLTSASSLAEDKARVMIDQTIKRFSYRALE